MKKVLDILYYIVLFVWQLPQNILALLMMLFFFMMQKKTEYLLTYDHTFVFRSKGMSRGSISLGMFVLMHWRQGDRKEVIQHELGHCWWSKVLGPLYLIVIGLPSILWAVSYKLIGENNYYIFYTEKWANKKGFVKEYVYAKNYYALKIIKAII